MFERLLTKNLLKGEIAIKKSERDDILFAFNYSQIVVEMYAEACKDLIVNLYNRKNFKDALKVSKEVLKLVKNQNKLNAFALSLKENNSYLVASAIEKRKLLSFDPFQAFQEIRELAAKGHLKSLYAFFINNYGKTPEDIAARVQEIEKKDEKTPMEYLVLASSHLSDPISVFGVGLEKIKNMRDLLNATDHALQKCLTASYKDLEVRQNLYYYLFNKLQTTPFYENCARAQIGLYFDALKNMRKGNKSAEIDAIAWYIEAAQGICEEFVSKQDLCISFDDVFYSKNDLYNIMMKDVLALKSENDLEIQDVFNFYCAKLNFDENNGLDAVRQLNNIAVGKEGLASFLKVEVADEKV